MPDRQVTVLFRESWDAACRELGVALPWPTRRANLFVEGMETPRRGQFRVGEVVLEVTCETAPCQVMEAAHWGLRAALKPDWRGGVCCRVVTAGNVRISDAVELL
jgi:MOSC domain-containing protein YiiM